MHSVDDGHIVYYGLLWHTSDLSYKVDAMVLHSGHLRLDPYQCTQYKLAIEIDSSAGVVFCFQLWSNVVNIVSKQYL